MADCNKILEGKLVPLPACNLGSGKEGKKASALYTENGRYQLLPEKGYNISEADITVQVSQTPTQEKAVTITENGDTVISPDAGKVLSKVTVTTDVQPDTTTFGIEYNQNGIYKIKDPDGKLFTEGVITVNVPSQIDLTQIGFNEVQNQQYNEPFLNGIAYAKALQNDWSTIPPETMQGSTKLLFFPSVFPNKVKVDTFFFGDCKKLEAVAGNDYIFSKNANSIFRRDSNLKVVADLKVNDAETLESWFSGCEQVKRIVIKKSQNVKTFYTAFYNCYSLDTLEIESAENATNMKYICYANRMLRIANIAKWKYDDITIDSSTILSLDSIRFIIDKAITAPENVRKLTLNSAVGKLFEQEPDFTVYRDLASSKGITIQW